MPPTATGSISPSRSARRLTSCPLEAGLIVADPYGAEIVREAELQRMAPASRRAVLLRFAQAAADRHRLPIRLADPAGTAEEFLAGEMKRPPCGGPSNV